MPPGDIRKPQEVEAEEDMRRLPEDTHKPPEPAAASLPEEQPAG